MHIPNGFTTSRPPVQFTSEKHNISVSEHALDGTMPSTWDKPCILDAPETLDDILAGPDAPTCFDDWLFTDRPGLAVHVINFTDATFVTLTYSHCLVDGVGKREIVLNWCKVLAGRMSDVVPMASHDEDPMRDIVESAHSTGDEKHVHEKRRIVGWCKYYWVFRLIGYLFRYPNRRQRNLYIPASTVAKIRAEADLSYSDDYLSDNQLITTWLVRFACSPFKSSNRPVGITSALDLRGFRIDGIRSDAVYLQNLLGYTWTNTTSNLLLRQPLGVAASAMRISLKEQLSVEQVRAAACLTYTAMAATGTPYLFTDKDSFVVSVSSLAKAKYWEVVDFGPAVVGGSEKGVHIARPVWQCSTPRSGFKPPCLVVVQGKDGKGNWWAQMVLSDRIWKVIETELQKW